MLGHVCDPQKPARAPKVTNVGGYGDPIADAASIPYTGSPRQTKPCQMRGCRFRELVLNLPPTQSVVLDSVANKVWVVLDVTRYTMP